MKILAVSDKEDSRIQNAILKNIDRLKDIDLIISCGDLSKHYLEFLVDTIRKEFFFVEGNHPILTTQKKYIEKIVSRIYDDKSHFNFGGINLHARLEIYKDYIFVGFEGSMRYNHKDFQYTEKQMSKIVNKISFKIIKQKIKDFILRKPSKKIIVVSHAPIYKVHDQEDICHQGFKCFRKFLNKMKPVLWLHGHIHYEGQINEQITKINDTTILNTYGFHIIDILDNKINITSNSKNFNS